ncbi:unnamed protein product [Brassicogethes aeneus]|uniref:Mitochondrial fission process protein 1 n=1 Tax=Brassicogethes aeneus TaxID=1431903 RepID=A0A9P0ATR0_BRAAE|nr:unnamed protein product [Brassicogethes aeneus]
MENAKKTDLYRETPVRYLGYANELGEAFRAFLGSKLVNVTYGIASLYVLADTTDKSIQAHKTHFDEKNHVKKVIFTTADTLIWQFLASVIIPGVTINRVCATSNYLLKKVEKLPKNNRKYLVTAIGLVTIPFIIHPIDNMVDDLLDVSLRKFKPE